MPPSEPLGSEFFHQVLKQDRDRSLANWQEMASIPHCIKRILSSHTKIRAPFRHLYFHKSAKIHPISLGNLVARNRDDAFLPSCPDLKAFSRDPASRG
jgi:hypothetical protein